VIYTIHTIDMIGDKGDRAQCVLLGSRAGTEDAPRLPLSPWLGHAVVVCERARVRRLRLRRLALACGVARVTGRAGRPGLSPVCSLSSRGSRGDRHRLTRVTSVTSMTRTWHRHFSFIFGLEFLSF
jgi:hypothetical protein